MYMISLWVEGCSASFFVLGRVSLDIWLRYIFEFFRHYTKLAMLAIKAYREEQNKFSKKLPPGRIEPEA